MKARTSAALLGLALALAACDSGHTSWELTSRQTSSSSTGGTTVRVTFTDAPFPFDALRRAVVAIRRIEIRGTDGAFRALVDLGEEGREIDLVPLRNGVAAHLGDADLRPGAYDAIRVFLEARELVLDDDDGTPRRFVDLAHDADAAVEIRLDPPLSADLDRVRELLIDLDLARSFVAQALPAEGDRIAGFRFEPRLRAGCVDDAGALTFRVASDAGTPADPSDDHGLLGAEVTLTSLGDEVAAAGASGVEPDGARRAGFVLHRAVPAGDYRLEIAARGHEPHESFVAIVAAERTDVGTITLAQRPASIRGTVVAEVRTQAGEPVSFALPLARVEVSFAAGGGVVARDRANAVGAYEIAGLVPGRYAVRAPAFGFAPAEAVVTVDSEAPVPLDFVLAPATTDVGGTVRNAAGNAQPGATVRAVVLVGRARRVVAETTADLDGGYGLVEMPTGVYVMEAESEGGAARRWFVLRGGGELRTLDLTVR